MGSWPIIFVLCGISFGLGALWHSKHKAARKHTEAQRNQYRRDVNRIARASAIDTTYRYSREDLKRRGAE